MVWGYPLFGDDPQKLRRKKIDHAWERGVGRANLAWEYETANKLAQGVYYIKEEHSIHSIEEEGLGSTDDMMLTAEQAAGNVEIDPEEVEKIKRILPTVDRGDGVGIATLIGAKDGMFAFRYNGPLTHKFGFKQWLRYLITANYPGAKVRLVTEHAIDPGDRPGNQKHRLQEERLAQIRKVVFWRRPYLYENEQEAHGPNPLGHVASPQQIR
ncbi:conserved hypothetical protein [Neospora caninum Liverpool]|uniref:Uncharacterized protein n=1 Tax=Neospora caninum (strain Liverpool) TaxID=572307 RepID=F0V8W7_NEOCL|nr:conserved hypothetical protein [Neospora caninum Liverpool]CBZ50158.1 conserved hypothetical protein [Neospora caninum Liverpool]CEL64753.1 TPA: hypothetical protein BN1204_006340 [Neospora caninum Liverpool]|eukprot:XP_003880193.1 conserved hypothetical protein [Neospora caninum Liverpool]